jgi:hypothetical protein
MIIRVNYRKAIHEILDERTHLIGGRSVNNTNVTRLLSVGKELNVLLDTLMKSYTEIDIISRKPLNICNAIVNTISCPENHL